MTIPTMTAVNSSMLAAIGYDAAEQKFYARFNNGKTYEYYGVPVEAFHNVRDAASVGSAFNSTIKHNYAYAELPR